MQIISFFFKSIETKTASLAIEFASAITHKSICIDFPRFHCVYRARGWGSLRMQQISINRERIGLRKMLSLHPQPPMCSRSRDSVLFSARAQNCSTIKIDGNAVLRCALVTFKNIWDFLQTIKRWNIFFSFWISVVTRPQHTCEIASLRSLCNYNLFNEPMLFVRLSSIRRDVSWNSIIKRENNRLIAGRDRIAEKPPSTQWLHGSMGDRIPLRTFRTGEKRECCIEFLYYLGISFCHPFLSLFPRNSYYPKVSCALAAAPRQS